MTLPQHFKSLAGYNRWANQRLYDACAALPENEYFATRPAFFKSIHGTLNHLLVGDLMWIGRITGVDSGLKRLDAALYPDLPALRQAREAEDGRFIELVDGLGESDLQREHSYQTLTFGPMSTPLRR